MPKAEPRNFKYQKRDAANIKERANMRGGNFDTIIKSKYKVWTPRDGKNIIRILPPTWADATHYGLDIYVNYGIGVDNQSYLSLFKMLGDKNDPLAEARQEAEKDNDKEMAKALSPRQRIVYYLIDRNGEDEGPQIWPAPFTFDKDLANICYDEDTKEVIMLDDPDEGRDLRFYKEGKGLNTSYEASKMKLLPASYIHEDKEVQDDWLGFITDNPLTECLQYYDAEHIAAAFNGHVRMDRKDKDKDDDRSNRSRSRDSDRDERPSRSRDRDDERHSRSRDKDNAPDEKPSRSRSRDEEPVARSRSRVTEPADEEHDPDTGELPDEKPARSRLAADKDDVPFDTGRKRASREPEPDADAEPEVDSKVERRGRGDEIRERLASRRSPEPEERTTRRSSRDEPDERPARRSTR